MKKLFLGCALTALATGNAYAQSTGSQDFQRQEIVVTGTRAAGVAGVQVPDAPKARGVLTNEFIQHETPGQSIDETINMLPGVSFQNNDPYGNSGGTLTIRGFDATRISQTIDGIPLNDTGNYAIYSQQQIDPELIQQVNVNLGTTDIDSPTASATGSTVNLRTVNPTEDFHIQLENSFGQYNYWRLFTKVDTGNLTASGTRAWFSASHAENRNPFNALSSADKFQYNGKIYQPVGSNGDFVWIAGNYNYGRNGNFSSIPLRVDQTILNAAGAVTGTRVVGSASSNRFPISTSERDYTLAPCQTAAARTGVADSPNTCGTVYDQSFNPSNTWNIRVSSRFTLADGLVLTVDPNYQYVKANGGTGAVKGNEGTYTRAASGTTAAITTPLTGYIGGQSYFGGVDLNGDGDVLDTPGRLATGALTNTGQGVEVYAPSQTGTHRIAVLTSLRYDVTPTQHLRVTYTYDHGRHRQTGPVGLIATNGYAISPFPIDSPLLDVNGNIMQKRNRLSYAILNQVAGEYRGEFLDSRLTITGGVRAPFFTRKLNNFCVTETGGSFVDCFNGEPASQAAFLAANPAYVPPTKRTFHFHKVLPQAGATFDFTPQISAFGSYSKGLQVPGTDNLYQSLGFAAGTALPTPETTDNFDAGVRYRSSKIQAQIAGWYTNFSNRLASAYDPTLDITVYRNLGQVHKYGVDANVAYKPVPEISLIAFGSYLKSKILNNVNAGTCTAAYVTARTNGCTAVGQAILAQTAGKRESGAPVYTVGGRIEGNFGPLEVGAQAKRTGRRYVNDQNLPIFQCAGTTQVLGCAGTAYQVFGAIAKGYTTVDLDARLSLAQFGFRSTYVQLNVTNLFDKLYVAGFTGGYSQFNVPFSYIGAPRAVSGTLNIGF